MQTSHATFLAKVSTELLLFPWWSLSSFGAGLSLQYPAQSPALQGAQTLFVEWNGRQTDSSRWSCHCRVQTGPETSNPSRSLTWRRWTTTCQETLTKTISDAWFLHRIISHPLQLYLFIWARVILGLISCSSAPTSLSPISSWNVQLSPEGYSEPSPTLADKMFPTPPFISGTKHRFSYLFLHYSSLRNHLTEELATWNL